MRKVDTLFRLRSKSIGYCTYEGECKIAATGLPGANGIIRGYDGTFYVTNNEFGGITLLEQLEDNNLNVIDSIPTGDILLSPIPVLSLIPSRDADGQVILQPKRAYICSRLVLAFPISSSKTEALLSLSQTAAGRFRNPQGSISLLGICSLSNNKKYST